MTDATAAHDSLLLQLWQAQRRANRAVPRTKRPISGLELNTAVARGEVPAVRRDGTWYVAERDLPRVLEVLRPELARR